MKTIITYGTFDVLHKGHIRLLTRARKLGDRLIVALSTDGFNRQKGKVSVFSYAERRLILSQLKCVDKIIPERSWGQKRKDIKAVGASIFVIGDDWKGKFDDLQDLCDVVYLSRTKGISTTKIKKRMSRIKHI